MRLIKLFAVLLCFAIMPLTPAHSAEEDNKLYRVIPAPMVLDGPDDGRVEVISFFWYGCGTCFRIDPDISEWASKLPNDVRFIRKHVDFGNTVNFHARVFLALRELGLSHQADLKVFKFLQQDRKPLKSLADLPALALELGLDTKKLAAAVNSKEVQAAEVHLNKLMEAYGINAVPCMVIDGTYIFDVGQTDGPVGYFKQAEELIEQRRKARKAALK